MLKNITEEIYQSIIKDGIEQYFQPIISMKKQRLIGAESLARGFYNGEQVDTGNLFEYARFRKKIDVINKRCIDVSIDRYSENIGDYLLFCNVDASQLQYYVENVQIILDDLSTKGVSTEKIVIEINEKKVASNSILVKFVECYKSKGFLIALDDIGEEESNYNRIALVRPDIIKIDYFTTIDIEKNYYKKSIVESIAYLAGKIGAVVIAEGVETKEQIFTYLSMGIDLFQGFYFSKAIPLPKLLSIDFTSKYQSLLDDYKYNSLKILNIKTQSLKAKKKSMRELCRLISISREENFESIIYQFIKDKKDIECIYLLNNEGTQITRTIFSLNTKFSNIYLFSPFQINDSHSMCSYFYIPMNNKKSYISDEYISAATGNFCVTYSGFIKHINTQNYIICIDYISIC